MVAGPNGAGKTSLVTRKIEGRLPVVNPDVIAAGLPRVHGKLDERGAGALALHRREELLAERVSFAVETTLTGNSTLRLMGTALREGYKVTLIFVGLRDADLSLSRVLARVEMGGHPVPVSAVLRRFPVSLANLSKAIELADRSFVLDNSGERLRLLLVRESGRDRLTTRDLPAWFIDALAIPI